MTALACLATAQASAQAPGSAAGWVRESWSIVDGLPVNSINALLQSRSGYIWAATYDGLVRFDGVRFTVFNSANTPGLPSDRITTISETRDSSIWLTTEQRHLVRFKRGRFTHFGRSLGVDGGVTAIREDGAGTIWIGTDKGVGVLRGGRFEAVAADAIRHAVTVLVPDPDGALWVGTEGHGVYRVAGERAHSLSGTSSLDSAVVNAIFVDSRRQVWVSSSDRVWRVTSGGHPTVSGRTWPGVAQKFIELPTTGEVLGYSPSGIVRYEPDRLVVVQSRVHLFAPSGPVRLRGADSLWAGMGPDLFLNGRLVYSLSGTAGANITALLFDREGGIWLGTDGMGLLRLRRSLFTAYGTAEGVLARNAYVVARDSSDGVWIGSSINGLTRVDQKRRTVSNYTTIDGGSAVVGSLLVDGPDRLLVGLSDGLATCSLPILRCSHEFRVPPAQLMGWEGVLAVQRTARRRLLAGFGSGVLERIDGRWRTLAGWTREIPARAFAEGLDGTLWIGTNGGGVVRCSAARCQSITSATGLPSDLIRSLLIDSDGWLWIGTEGRGLVRLDTRRWPANDTLYAPPLVRIGVTDGLYDPVVHQILDDGLGRYWMSSNRGIFWVRRTDLMAFADGRSPRVRSVSYTERDGLRNREANGGYQPAGVRDADGRLWFATQAGVASIDPARIPREQAPPPVVIEQLTARTRTLSADTTEIALDATERDIEIAYTSLSFREPRNVRFRYRLEPYDADWVDAGVRRTAFYTRVPPGSYTFRVAASQGGDRWSERPASIRMTVAPLFRETLLAKGLFAMMLVLTGVAIARWRLQQVRQREVALTALVEERTAALRHNERELAAQNDKLAQLNQLRSRLFANLSHEFRTPLTLILGPLRSLLDGRHGTLGPTIREQAELMQRNGQRLLRLINQILDLARLQAGAVAITRQPLDLVAFTRTVAQAFSPLADRQGIAVVFRSPLRTLTVDADGDQLEKVVLNLLSNAVKFTGAGGIVDVSVASDAGDALITVRDTGVGISAAELPRIFERFYQVDGENTRKYDGTGIGLALVKELVDLHGGEISVSSVVGEGTTFVVRLPIGAVPTQAATHTTLAPETIDDILGLGAALPAGEFPQEESADDRVTVLVVDDNDDMRTYVRSILATSFHVLEAADGQAGLVLAREALPDLIVADVMMPELDGLGLAAALKGDAMTDAIPVVLLTARAAAEDQIAGLEAGADAYLVKPFDPGVLTACVENLLTQRQKLRERFRAGEAPPPESVPVTPSPLDLHLRALVQVRLLEPDFSPESLATAAGLSYHQLYRSLRDELGSTPSKYIRTVRAECAAALLRRGEGNVTEVAYAVGFESLSYFRRAFKERFDCSPSEFMAADPR